MKGQLGDSFPCIRTSEIKTYGTHKQVPVKSDITGGTERTWFGGNNKSK